MNLRQNKYVRRLAEAKRVLFPGKPAARQAAAQKQEKEPVCITRITPPKTVADLKPEYCTGCGACSNICPTQAITMEFDREGFLAPVVHEDKCVNCGLCAKTCPVIHVPQTNSPDPACYAFMHQDDEIRRSSSSGGVFTLAADYVLEQGGCVCGVELTEDMYVRHTIVETKEQLARLRGSKYVQSNTGDCYRRIKELLQTGRLVLFTGTPCQCAGLRNFLQKDYDNLLVIDLICHGAPSLMVFHKYLADYYGLENVKDFKFRTKEFGYNSFHQSAFLKDGTKVDGNIRFDAYEKIMHSGISLKAVCGDCMFAPAPRQGDLTMGDFWGVSKHNPAFNDNLGTSCLLVNNHKGEAFLQKIREKTKLLEQVPYEVARQNNRFGRKMHIPAGRSWLFNMMKTQSIDKAAEYALNRKFDIGIIGLWYGRNYGSMATYYALHTVLKDMGFSVLMIENCLRPDGNREMEPSSPRLVAERFYDVSAKYSVRDLNKLNAHCDTFIVGSDQLWNVYLSRPYGQTYYLGFADDSKKKIAYGTSFGIPYCGSSEERLISGYNLRRFDHVSVRDKLSQDSCKDLFGVDAQQVCDPTFLCPIEAYNSLANQSQLTKTQDYILAYILDPTPEIISTLNHISQDTHVDIFVVMDEDPAVRQRNLEKFGLLQGRVKVLPTVTLYEWLWYYQNASAVITDSFHGTIFSIIFQKSFLTLTNKRRGAERFVSLLEPLGLRERLFEQPEKLFAQRELLGSLDYTKANEALAEIRSQSLQWLKNAIYSEKTYTTKTVYDIHAAKEEER